MNSWRVNVGDSMVTRSVYRDYTDISIAVATPKGLVVPCPAQLWTPSAFAEVEKARAWTAVHALKDPPQGLKEIFAQHALGRASLRGRHERRSLIKISFPKARLGS